MTQRSSRSKKVKGRSSGAAARKQPELRTGGGRTAKAQRSQARVAAGTNEATRRGPKVRVRPAGATGFAFTLVVAWIGVAIIAFLGAVIGRWNIVSYPDSLWLYVSFGAAAVAPVFGAVARSRTDIDSWTAQALLVPLGMLLAEVIFGPGCPQGGGCGAIGARGSLGLFWSVVVIVGFAALAWLLSRTMYERARKRRPNQGRVKYSITAVAMVTTFALLSAPLAIAFAGVDVLVRDTPKDAKQAISDVTDYCLDLGGSEHLEVRAAPSSIYTGWTSFAVRRASEHRPGIGKAKLPSNWTDLNTVYPYEALVVYDGSGDRVTMSCNRIDPAAGNAKPSDLTPNNPESNPMDPKTTGADFMPSFYTQGPKEDTPTPTATKAAAKAKTAKAKAKVASASTKK